MQHLRDRQFHAVADELRADPAFLQGPDRAHEPGFQGHVFGDAPEQGHGRMGVRVDQPGQQNMGGFDDMFARREARAGLRRGAHGDDATMVHAQRMVLEHGAPGLDGNEPAYVDQQVDGFHGER